MKREALTAKRAWQTIGLGVLAYELSCPQGELLSEGADKAIGLHPYLTRLAIGVVALHLTNALPEKYDPLHQALRLIK